MSLPSHHSLTLPDAGQLAEELEALRARLYELEEMEVARVTEEQERFDSLGVLDEYAKQLEESRDKLTRLFRAAAAVQEARTIQTTLQRIADAVHEAGWGSVSVSLFKNWAVVQAAYVGCTQEDIAFLESNRRSPDDRARQFGPDFARFKVSRSYFVPAEELPSVIPVDTVVPGRREVQPGDEWNPMDLAYVPLYGSGGRVIGAISCDDPVDGKRPTPDAFFYLELFADLAANKVETTRLLEQQRRTAEAYRESEEKYRTVFSRSGDGFFLMDEYFRDCNAMACEIFGCTRGDLIGASPVNFSPEFQPDGRLSTDSAREKIMAALAGTPQQFYWKHKRKDGSLIDCEVKLSAVEISGEGLILAIVRDISERCRAEAAMKENEERFRSLADATPVMIWMVNEDGEMTYLNRIGVEQIGLTSELPTRRNWDEWVHEADFDRIRNALQTAIFDQRALKLDFRVRSANGGFRWVSTTGVPRFAADGKFLGLIGTCVDDHDQRETIARLQESECLVQRILDASPDMLYIFDLADHRMVRVSASVERGLGFKRDDPELLSPNFIYDRVHPDDLIQYNVLLAELAEKRDGSTIKFQWRFRDKFEHWRWIESHNAIFLRDDEGRALQVVGSARDITNHRLLNAKYQVIAELSRLLRIGASRESLFQNVPRLLAEKLGFPVVAIETLNENGDCLDFSGQYGFPVHIDGIPVESTCCGRVLSSDEPLASADIRADADPGFALCRQAGLRAYVAAPMRINAKPYGVLIIADLEPRPEVGNLVETLKVVADFLAFVIERTTQSGEDAPAA